MKTRYETILGAAKAAIIAGDSSATMAKIDEFVKLAQRRRIAEEDRALFEGKIAELRQLAEASARGTRIAIDLVKASIEAASSLQTYDEAGRKHRAVTAAPAAQRF